MYVCMYVYHTAVLVPGEPLRSYRGNLNWCIPYLHQTEFCILVSLAIWLRSRGGGSVTVAAVGLTV